jgi:non-specific serine/threonine protein kinase/serine/threonine-protein kinase
MSSPVPPGRSPEFWERVHERFHEALELDSDGRGRLLAALELEDAGLARQVRSLLAAHEQSSDFLAQPPALPRSIGIGDRLGAYRVIEQIGRGGMGIVYRATRDDGDFSHDVAIKLIDPGLHSEGILRRFRAERSILAMLNHPHIVRLLDGGSAPDGSPYLVMEHVVGTSLLDYCDTRRLGIDARIELFLQVCDAVQFAHQRLVVHRDLKSDNIVVTEEGSARLLDFGIAKLIAPETGLPAGTLTSPMQRLLTPDYASPEQIRGEPVSVASDIYSLGVVLYELLSGARPLKFETRTPEEVLRVVTQVDPIPPSAAAARSPEGDAARRRGETTQRLRKRLAGDLDYIALRALEKDPARRYGSVEQLAQDLGRYRDGLPVLARGRSATYRVSRFVRRHRAGVIATSLVTLALIAGLIGTTWQANVARRERDLATRRFEDVRGLAHTMVFDLHDAIAPLQGSTRARELLVTSALRYLDRLRGESNGDPKLQSELAGAYFKIGDVQGQPMFSNLGLSDSASASYEKCRSLLEALAVAWPESLEVKRNLIVVTQRLAEMQHISGHLKEALAMQVEAKGRIAAEWAQHPDYEVFRGDMGVACDRLYDLRLYMGDTLGALSEMRDGDAAIRPWFETHPHDPGSRRAMIINAAKAADLYAALGRRDTALALYGRSEQLAREAVSDLPHDTDALRDLSIIYGMHGSFLAGGGAIDPALEMYGRGQKIVEDLVALDSANVVDRSGVAKGHYEIGEILMKGGRYEPAVGRFEEAYRRFTVLASMDTSNAEARTSLARSGRKAGEACEALASRGTPISEREQWRVRALDWYARSLGVYRRLDASGALAANEATAPREIEARVAALRRAGAP